MKNELSPKTDHVLNSYLKNSSLACFTLKEDYSISFFNHALSISLEKPQGHSILDFIPLLYHKVFKQEINKVNHHQKEITLQLPLTNNLNQTISFEWFISSTSSSTEPYSVILIKSEEKKDIEQFSRYSMFENLTSEALVQLQHGKIKDFNLAFTKLLNVENNLSLIDVNINEIFVAESQLFLEEILSSPHAIEHALTIEYPHGFKIPVRVKGKAFHDHHHPSSFISIIEDSVTQNMKKELLSQHSFFESAFSLLKAGSWYKDIFRQQLYWSKNIRKIFDYPLEKEAPVNAWEDFIHPDDKTRVLNQVRNNFFEGNIFELEFRIITYSQTEKTIFTRQEYLRNLKGKVIRINGVVIEV